ncbi:MAG: hypothetical protein P1U56_25120 [Saprospiraceae bacterium]|nr:hypothetical protein [Saprospiraceae bacterium]
MDLIDIKYLIKHLVKLNLNQTRLNSNSEEWYYFMHIPKTAGTSIRYMLYDQFSANTVYPNNVDYYFKNNAKYLYPGDFKDHYKDILKPDIKVLIGHYGMFPIRKCRNQKPRTFAFFRNPVNRVISELNYSSKKGRRYDGLTLEEKILESKKTQGREMAAHLGYNPRLNNLEEAIENLNQIDVVGITEYFSESIELLNKTFDWSLPNNYHRNKLKKSIPLDDAYMKEIHEYCEIDRIIYDKAKELFFEKCKAKGIEINS